MNTVQSFDLIIIGAGPAGISTALHLIQMDLSWKDRMVVIEKEIHPRHKLCGGGVTRFGLRILRDLGLPIPFPIPHVEIENIHLLYRNRKIHVRGQPQFIIFHRQEFDTYLVAHARENGVRIQEDEIVTSLGVKSDGVAVATTRQKYQAKVVVGADGAKGIVRRSVHARTSPQRVARLLEVFLPESEDSCLFQHKTARFDFSLIKEKLQGYYWHFPAQIEGQPSSNRGVYDARMAKWQNRANLPHLLKSQLSLDGETPKDLKIQGHPLRWYTPVNRVSTHRIVLVGDAAGADPLFGEGIGPALGYGKIAAQAIAAAFSKDDFRFSKYAQEILRSSLGVYLWWRWFGAVLLYNLGRLPFVIHIVWTVGQIVAAIWRAGPL